MKPVSLLIALLLCSPSAGFAQAPPAPPAPPAPAVIAVPPVPPAPVALPAPPAVPAPRAVPAPPAPPHPAPLVDIAFPDIDIQIALDQAHEAIRNIDIDHIREEALRATHEALQDIDLERIKADAKMQAEWAKERAKEISKQSFELTNMQNDWNPKFDLNLDLNFGPQGRGPVMPIGPMGSRDESGQYSAAKSLVDRRQYEQAIVRFDQVAAMRGPHADGALYWKAYSQYKLGRTDDALATIAELRRSHAQSKYVPDAQVLEADAKRTQGKPLTGDADDTDIKILAINAMQNSNPEGAVPLLESVLKATNSLAVKRRALFVLAQNELPAAHQVLLRYAKGAGNVDLQLEAIRYLTARGKQTTVAELDEVYNSTQDLDVRRAVLDALISMRDRTSIIKIAGSDAPLDIRRRAINGLGNDNMMTAAELYTLYQKETDKDLRNSMVNAFGSMGAVDQLSQLIKAEKDADVRNNAIRRLGSIKTERATQLLTELYSANEDINSRKAVASALGNQGNAAALIAIARKETNQTMKLELVRRITDLASRDKAAMDYLMELVK
jgi:HEAT repeat protein/TolA-binding protein